MHPSLLGFVALVGICSARPAQSDLSQDDASLLNGPSNGFPVEYLPIRVETPSQSSTQDISNTNLKIPIVPAQHRDFRPLITYVYEDRPKGFELAASLAINIYTYWKDVVNQRIVRPTSSRRLPFSNFLHTVEPRLTPGAVLTPVEVGLAYCYLLQGVIEKTPASWPGHMGVRMQDLSAGPERQKVEIGVIIVENNPAGDTDRNTSPTPSNTTSATSKPPIPANVNSASIETEKRWLACWSKVLFFFTTHSPSARFTDDSHRAPSSTPVAYYWPCGNAKDEMTVTLYPAASGVLLWDTIVRSMLDWVNKAAMQPWGYIFSEEVIQEGRTMAALSIKLGRQGGGRADGVATT
ncbi:MAG: hypothetical protein L6R36_006367 [Xanthoria steineri]|nr:MAG: hypothetical protein L6R36_006367 [Xanthoria steineri]